MVNRIDDGPPASPLRFVLYLALAVATLTGTLAGPARAENVGAQQPSDNQDANQNNRGNDRHQRSRHRDSQPQAQYNNNPQSEIKYGALSVVVPSIYYRNPTPFLTVNFPLIAG